MSMNLPDAPAADPIPVRPPVQELTAPDAAAAVEAVSLPKSPTKRLIFAIAGGYFGIWMAFFSPIVLLVPLRVAVLAPNDKAGALSWILGFSAIFGILAGPITGRLSDRSTSRFGRRRPYIFGSFLLGVVGMALEGLAPSLVLFFIGLSIGAVAFSASMTMIFAVVPEHIPPGRRGTVSGLLGVSQSVAVVVGVGIGGALSKVSLAAAFIVLGVIGLALSTALCAVLPDRPAAGSARIRLTAKEIFGSFRIRPGENPDFSWALVSRFMLFMAFAGITNYQVFYLTDQLGVPTGDAAGLVGIGVALQAVGVILGSVVSGRLSDRIGRRKIFVAAAAGLGALALLILALATVLPLYFVAILLGGIAQGVYSAVDLALMTDLLPAHRDDDGRHLGIVTLSNQLPQSLAPAIAPGFLAIGAVAVGGTAGANYMSLFIASAAFAALSAVAVSRVRRVR